MPQAKNSIESIRISKIVTVLICAILAAGPGLNNLIDYNINFVFVEKVLTMDNHVADVGTASFRAINSVFLHHVAYISIIISELAVAVLGIWGAIDLWKVRRDPEAFNQRKGKAIASLTLGIFVWGILFLAIGGEWFMMWLSENWNPQQPAFRLYVIFISGLIYLSIKD